jgi:hypothetical protein
MEEKSADPVPQNFQGIVKDLTNSPAKRDNLALDGGEVSYLLVFSSHPECYDGIRSHVDQRLSVTGIRINNYDDSYMPAIDVYGFSEYA